jgi:hypothetical protein
MGPIGCPETLVRNCGSTLPNIPEEHRSHLYCCRSLKSQLLTYIYQRFPNFSLHATLFWLYICVLANRIRTVFWINVLWFREWSEVIRNPSKDIFNFSSVHLFMFLCLLQKNKCFQRVCFWDNFENRGRLTPWDSQFMLACYAGVGVPAGFDVHVYTWLTIFNALFTYCGKQLKLFCLSFE